MLGEPMSFQAIWKTAEDTFINLRSSQLYIVLQVRISSVKLSTTLMKSER